MVKNAFAQWSKGCTCPKEFPVCVCGNKPKGKALKSVAPSAAELEENPRARSARLRVFEKILKKIVKIKDVERSVSRNDKQQRFQTVCVFCGRFLCAGGV